MLAWLAISCGLTFELPLFVAIAAPPVPTAEPDVSAIICAIAGAVFLLIAVILWREPPLPKLDDES